jgi:hypothetical protein
MPAEARVAGGDELSAVIQVLAIRHVRTFSALGGWLAVIGASAPGRRLLYTRYHRHNVVE